MAEVVPTLAAHTAPLVIKARVSPWGFVVALLIAAGLFYLGARIIDVGLKGPGDVSMLPWLAGLLPIGFGLFLSLVGIGELARYVKPAVEVVMDRDGLTTYGVLGARRTYWDDMVGLRIEDRVVSIRARQGGMPKTVRLHLDRLEIEPGLVLHRIRQHRPDLAPSRTAFRT